jgi:hypothetical protein
MFLGRTDEARQLYFVQKGTKAGVKAIREDFAELRRAGLDAPLMHDIEAELSKQ